MKRFARLQRAASRLPPPQTPMVSRVRGRNSQGIYRLRQPQIFTSSYSPTLPSRLRYVAPPQPRSPTNPSRQQQLTSTAGQQHNQHPHSPGTASRIPAHRSATQQHQGAWRVASITKNTTRIPRTASPWLQSGFAAIGPPSNALLLPASCCRQRHALPRPLRAQAPSCAVVHSALGAALLYIPDARTSRSTAPRVLP